MELLFSSVLYDRRDLSQFNQILVNETILVVEKYWMSCVLKILTIIYEFSTSPDGRFLVFLSARSAVDSGVHNATNSLHRIDWPIDGKPVQSSKIYDIVSSSYVASLILMYLV